MQYIDRVISTAKNRTKAAAEAERVERELRDDGVNAEVSLVYLEDGTVDVEVTLYGEDDGVIGSIVSDLSGDSPINFQDDGTISISGDYGSVTISGAAGDVYDIVSGNAAFDDGDVVTACSEPTRFDFDDVAADLLYFLNKPYVSSLTRVEQWMLGLHEKQLSLNFDKE